MRSLLVVGVLVVVTVESVLVAVTAPPEGEVSGIVVVVVDGIVPPEGDVPPVGGVSGKVVVVVVVVVGVVVGAGGLGQALPPRRAAITSCLVAEGSPGGVDRSVKSTCQKHAGSATSQGALEYA